MSEFEDLGKQIQDIVQRAIGEQNFDDLNRRLSSTIDVALQEVNKGLDEVSRSLRGKDARGRVPYGRHAYPNTENADYRYRASETEREQREASKWAAQARRVYDMQASQSSVPVYNPNKGRFAAPAFMALGAVGITCFGISFLTMLALGFAGFGILFYGLALALFLPLTGVSLAGLIQGLTIRRRNRRFRLYRNLLGFHMYILLSELAAAVGRSTDFARRDVQQMIQLGYFPQGRLDEAGTTLILNHETYRLYQDSLKQAAQREKELAEMKKSTAAPTREVSPEVRQVMEEGVRVVKQIRDANDVLEEAEISAKLDRLEKIVTRIFEYVVKNPDKLPDIRRFIQYYLPTTCKLVQVYQDLDHESIQTGNILKSKTEIRQTLDTINAAFENLLDSLYEETAMDVSSDISVLRTLLEQEGLTETDTSMK